MFDEPIDPTSSDALDLCQQAAECVHTVNHLTYADGGAEVLRFPADVYRALSALELFLERLPQALGQIAGRRADQVAAGEVEMDDATPYADGPDRVAADLWTVVTTRAHASALARRERPRPSTRHTRPRRRPQVRAEAMSRGIADRHFPDGDIQLIAAAHTWRCVLRQAAAYLDALTETPSDRATRVALADSVRHLNHACALLTTIQCTLDTDPKAGTANTADRSLTSPIPVAAPSSSTSVARP